MFIYIFRICSLFKHYQLKNTETTKTHFEVLSFLKNSHSSMLYLYKIIDFCSIRCMFKQISKCEILNRFILIVYLKNLEQMRNLGCSFLVLIREKYVFRKTNVWKYVFQKGVSVKLLYSAVSCYWIFLIDSQRHLYNNGNSTWPFTSFLCSSFKIFGLFIKDFTNSLR